MLHNQFLKLQICIDDAVIHTALHNQKVYVFSVYFKYYTPVPVSIEM